MSKAADPLAEYWDSLVSTVGAAVDAGRIGTPKALRLTVHVQADDPADAAEVRERTAAAARRCASAWFAGAADGDHGVGEARPAAAWLLRWPGGQSALLAVSAGRGATAGNVVLMGTHGSIYHRIEPFGTVPSREAP
ncbi:MAG: hypothetical protein OXJ90_08790 [Spirochaetaceae bacterium]|nr:hypothetical protein [Spirochaetaceae bacterium]